jgi:hypothetical protein
MPSQPELWSRIESFSLDEAGAALPFSARLARENQWSRDYSRRVLEEYKRFAYLALAAGHPVTPSDEVDQAWHLHMVYTRDYWDEFCGEILQRPLHHGPTKGGASENAKFENWYERTLDSYRAEFGAEPPADIWPTSEVRFGRAPHFARVNTRENWVIPKPSGRHLGAAAVGALALFASAGAAATEGTDWLGVAIGVGFIGLILVLVILAKRGGKGGKGGGGGSGCSSSGCSHDSSDHSDGGDSSGCSSSGCSSGCGGGCGGGD